jgi:valyl-tRNA synthetase
MADIPEKFLKPYDPQATEGAIYKKWEESGYFNPDNLPNKDGEPFSIVLPPPNATGTLHMGSALMLAIEDTLVRYKRMRGYKTLWVPGTDSAAIATQARVEKDIQKAEGKNRHDLGRDELLRRIDAFVEQNKNTMIAQMRAMGSSLDWSRYAYTMDKPRYAAVMEAFMRMHNAGLIYRANRIVNWDPKGQTTISDDEIVHEERKAKLVTFKYSKDFPLEVATTRLETKVGDTAVAVHPGDARYAQFVGKEYDAVFCGVPVHIKIVADESVDPAFGTGALGVTPAHSQTDWDIAERHSLPRPQVINEYARMTVEGPLNGKKVLEARETIYEWLKQEGLFVKEENIMQNVATAERTGGIIEPLPKLQWWVDVDKPIAERGGKSLKELMRESVASGRVQFVTERYERIYYNWVDNLRPWCISRQIWFGHRIPVWYRGEEIKVQVDSPGDGWTQEADVLDTWFSSGLWSFSTLGWPESTSDLKTYHPTSVIETGYDILFFWVARMILMSQFLLGDVPFKTVYLHGLVRDHKGQKISKSLGNNIDPVDMGATYGMDAVRVALIAGMAPGTDSKISEDKIRGYKNFANKVWNVSRFVLSQEQQGDLKSDLVQECDDTAKNITAHIETYRLDMAFDVLYHYVWDRFAAQILEESKGKPEYGATLHYILENVLKLLHPFMPFVTEEIWSSFAKASEDKGSLLMVQPWPVK